MNIVNGFIAFLATILAVIGFICFLVGGVSIGSGSAGSASYSTGHVPTLIGLLLMGGSIFLFSLVVRRWKKSQTQQQEEFHATLKTELREELRQEMGLTDDETQQDSQ